MLSWLINNSSSDSKTGKERLYRGWVMLAILFVIGVVTWGIKFSFGVFFKPLQADFGWSRVSTSGIFSTYMIICAVFTILAGLALDRYGPKKVILVMGCFTGLSLLLTSQANAMWHIFITYSLLLAIGSGAMYIIIMATISRWFTKRRGLALGIVSSAVGIGTLIMTPVSAYLIYSYGWHISYLILGVIALVVIIPCALFLKEAPSETERLPNAEKLAPSNHSTPKQGDFSVAQAVKTKSFWFLFVAWCFFSFCVYVVLTHIVPHAIDLGITPMKAALILSFSGGGNVLGRIVVGWLSDSIGRKPAAVICALLMAATMFWLTELRELWMLYLFAVIFGFSFGGFGPPTAAIISETFGLRHLGAIMGIVEVGYSIGAAAGPALAGYVFDTKGSYNPAFFTGMATVLIAMVLILLVGLPTAKKEPPV